jgi:PIN domain nuclease of toxin-antitoxin system
MDCVPDTHALAWFLEGDKRLSEKAREILSSPQSGLVVPTIVLAEIEFLYRKSRIGISLQTVLKNLEATGKCLIYPLDQTVVTRLPGGLEMHDAIIVATAIVNRDLLGRDTVIVTKDRLVREVSSIETAW